MLSFIQKPIKFYFCKTVCTQNFVQKHCEIHVPSCCCMCTIMNMVKTSAEGNIHRKTFAADMQFLHWRLHMKCTVVCVPQEQHIRLSQSMICSTEAEVKEKKKNLVCQASVCMCTWKYISIAYIFVCMPQLV